MIVWPAYIDSRKSRKQGRKIPMKDAVDSPGAGDIFRAAKKLQLPAKMESDKAYPPAWWEGGGRVVIEYDGKKRELLLKLSRLIRSSRSR